MDRVIGYVKVYTDNESANKLPGQIKQKNEITKYCQNNNLFLNKIIVEKVLDEKAETPLWNELIYKKNNDESLNKVVVFKSSILSKDFRFYLYSCFLLAKKEIELVSIKEDYIKENKITQRDKNLVYAMAFYEKKRMGFLFKEGRNQKRLSGELIPGTSPFGYKKVNGQYEVDSSEAEVVKLIFKMKDKQNKKITQIVAFLNENNISTRRGKQWNSISVSNILKNRKTYQGYIFNPQNNTYKKGMHERII